MKYLVAGLGNIGADYELTRHNIGFMVLDKLAAKQNTSFSTSRLAYDASFTFRGRHIHLIKPTTYMNLSGKAVTYWKNSLKIADENILVITDDIALPFGKLRIRAKGAAGGHNGLKDIEKTLNSKNYPRLRFGIGNDFPKGQQVDYVLNAFNEAEFTELPLLIDKAIDMTLSFCSIGIARTMNQYN